jgi:hypothetical protein
MVLKKVAENCMPERTVVNKLKILGIEKFKNYYMYLYLFI